MRSDCTYESTGCDCDGECKPKKQAAPTWAYMDYIDENGDKHRRTYPSVESVEIVPGLDVVVTGVDFADVALVEEYVDGAGTLVSVVKEA